MFETTPPPVLMRVRGPRALLDLGRGGYDVVVLAWLWPVVDRLLSPRLQRCGRAVVRASSARASRRRLALNQLRTLYP